MAWNLTTDVEEYLTEVGEFLRADPVANNLPLTVIETLRRHGSEAYGDAAAFGWWRSAAGGVEGAFHHTRPYPLLLSAMPEPAAHELAELLAHHHTPLDALNADQTAAHAFATTWTHRTGTAGQVDMRQRLYRLDRLRPPEPLPHGAPRTATGDDRDLVLAWYQAFQDDIAVPGNVRTTMVDDRLAYGGITLWNLDGTPVSLAGRTRVTFGVARVAPVYTPPEHRRRGFGAAATAAVTQSALDAGADNVVLFTDLANPTSNDIYQRIGYEPVSDRLLLTFTPRGL